MRPKTVVSAGPPGDNRCRALLELRFVIVPTHAAAELNFVLPELHRLAEERGGIIRSAFIHGAGVPDHAEVGLVRIGVIQIRARRRIRGAKFILRRFMGVIEAGDEFVFHSKRLEAEAHIELVRDDRVGLIARLKFAVDHEARVGHAGDKPRRSRDRVALRLPVTGRVPQAEGVARFLFVAKSAEIGVDPFFVPVEDPVEIVEIHRRRFVPKFLGQHRLRGRHPGNAIIRDVVLLEMKIAQRQLRIVTETKCQRWRDAPTAILHFVPVRHVSFRAHRVEPNRGFQKWFGDDHLAFARVIAFDGAAFPKRRQFLVNIQGEPPEIVRPDFPRSLDKKRSRATRPSTRD